MFIRLFAYAANDDEARVVAENCLGSLSQNISAVEYTLSEPYRKMDGVYKVELTVSFVQDLSDSQFKVFLDDVSDKWTTFGTPVNEYLASDTTEGCEYIRDGISLINIFMS